jgi:hypothetical protein
MSGSGGTAGTATNQKPVDDDLKVSLVSSDLIITAARASLKARDEISPNAGRSSQQGAERFLGFCHHMEKQ